MDYTHTLKTLNSTFFVLVHVKSTFNNILVTITDLQGNVLFGASPGILGFKGSKRATSYAAQLVGESLCKKMLKNGISTAKILLKGIGKGRHSVIMGLKSSGIVITAINDITNIPHNGCRVKKQRRV